MANEEINPKWPKNLAFSQNERCAIKRKQRKKYFSGKKLPGLGTKSVLLSGKDTYQSYIKARPLYAASMSSFD